MSNVTKAVELFRSGYACSQAIFATYGPLFGIDPDMAMKISSGFAGGMRTGDTCGAVTGAYMVLGAKLAKADSNSAAGRQSVYSAILEFASQFKELNKSIVCRDLLGCDLGTPEGKKQAEEKRLFTTICPRLVEDAARILEGLIEKKTAERV